MRLSEDRIRDLSRKMAADMIREGVVAPDAGERNLATLIAQIVINDLLMEDRIDELAREKVARYRNPPPPGTGEYDALFSKAKAEVAREKGYPL